MKPFYRIFLIATIPYFICGTMAAQSTGNGLPATDAVGRELPGHAEVGSLKEDKFIGLFYWIWHERMSRNNAPLDISKYLVRNPNAKGDYDNPIWPEGFETPWFWSEPLFGYYKSTDEWVLRKHAEMLADAGVDVIIFDCTNGNVTWKKSYTKLCKVFTEVREDGVQTPQIAFLLPFSQTSGGKEIIRELYTELYKPEKYKDLWFYWKGKPLIMAMPELVDDGQEDKEISALNREIGNFFTFRPGQPVYNKGPERPIHWGWLEIYPQHGFVKNKDGGFEQMPVGVAQNWSEERGVTAMNSPGAFGRNYTHKNGHNNDPFAVNYGYNFQEQWDRALEVDPEFIFITGWNEWIVGRHEFWEGQENAFPDQFNQRFSRDIEPMKGGHADNYYYQMVSNIRHFKGMSEPDEISSPVSVSIDGGFSEWENVLPEFTSYRGNIKDRDSEGWGSLYYINRTGRNDIVLAKVARDNKFVYFYVETADAMTPVTDEGWMRLFIDIDRDQNTGWEGYDFIVNRTNPEQKATLEKSKADWRWEKITEVDYKVNGNKLEIKIPKSSLGLNEKISFEFKWSDNMQQEGNILDFWVNGDVAPGGRFNFHYTTIK